MDNDRTRSAVLTAAKFALAAICLALALGCGKRPGAPQPNSATTKPSESERPGEQPVQRVSAEDLDDAFDDDEAAANAKYKDKVIEVTGTVRRIDRSDPAAVTVELKSGDAADDVIDCEFAPADSEQARALKKGESVVIRGTCVGLVKKTVTLERCSVMK